MGVALVTQHVVHARKDVKVDAILPWKEEYKYLVVTKRWSSLATVQLKCNFTHAWRSTHGYTQIFACKIQKVVEIFIFMRRGVA